MSIQGHLHWHCGCDTRHNGIGIPWRESRMSSWSCSAQQFLCWKWRCEGPSIIGSERPLLSPCLYCQFSSGWSLSGLLWASLLVKLQEMSFYDLCFINASLFRLLMVEGILMSGIERRMLMKTTARSSQLVHWSIVSTSFLIGPCLPE